LAGLASSDTIVINSAPPRLERELPEIGGAFLVSGTTVKPAKSLDEQLRLLEGRGLEIEDRELARRSLLNWNYYRLSGYFRQLQVDPRAGEDRFVAGTTFAHVVAARSYDVEFASVLLDGLFEVERVIRSRFAHFLAMQHGSAAFYLRDDAYLAVMDGRGEFVDKLASELARSRSATVRRYSDGQDMSAVPVWVAIELCSFGVVSKMLTYLADSSAARSVADSLSVQWATFASTVHSLSVARNVCAHHGQLWHRRMAVQTPLLKKEKRSWDAFDDQGPVPTALATMRLLRAADRACPRAERLESFLRRPSPLRAGLFHPAPR
jgi:abortive infection bacteriophage resistance protein